MQIDYEDVTGIKVHSEVRYAGAPAGRVIAMRHLSAGQRESAPNKRNAVRVTISLDENIPPLPADVTATLSSDTLLAPKFVALSAGTPGGETLANNATIEGHPCLRDRANHRRCRTALREREQADRQPQRHGHECERHGDQREKRSGTIPAEVLTAARYRENGSRMTSRRSSLASIPWKKTRTRFSTRRAKFIGTTDKQLQDQMKELHVILLNLKVISTHAKAITEALGEKPNRLIFSGKAKTLTPEAEILKSREPLPAQRP